MSFLRMGKAVTKIKHKPSPANQELSQINKNAFTDVKRISQSISHRGRRCVAGSMTVEAALLLPLFLFCFLHLAGVMEMLRFHGKLEAALWNAGNQMTLYTETFRQTTEDVPDMVTSYLVIHNMLVNTLGKDYLEVSPLSHGALGLNYLRSDYCNDEECIDIVVTYQVEPPVSIFPFDYRRMGNRYYARAWTGYDVSAQACAVQYVYITPQGEVWHRTPECSYLFHDVLSVPAERIQEQKNAQGKSYELCELCQDEPKDSCVYVTYEGEKYHFVRNCSAIHKDIRAVEWSEGLPYRACSRCALEQQEGG